MDFILIAFAFCIALNLLMFVPAYIFKTDKLTDLSYSLTFIGVAIFGFSHSTKSFLHILIASLIIVWAVRLGGFLVVRIRKIKRDKRFDGMRESFSRFIKFWLLQGISVGIISLAALLAWDSQVLGVTTVTAIGLVVFIVGITLESAADVQKFQFNQRNSSGTWIDEGVWRISRHPNYLGEMLIWTGIYLVALPSLSRINVLLGLISPLYIISLLMFVSGVPLLEKAADKKWGKDTGYNQYKKEVPLLIPTINSIKRVIN